MSEAILVEHDEYGNITQTPYRVSEEEFNEFKVNFEKTYGSSATVEKREDGLSIEIYSDRIQQRISVRLDQMDIHFALQRWEEWYQAATNAIKSSEDGYNEVHPLPSISE